MPLNSLLKLAGRERNFNKAEKVSLIIVICYKGGAERSVGRGGRRRGVGVGRGGEERTLTKINKKKRGI